MVKIEQENIFLSAKIAAHVRFINRMASSNFKEEEIMGLVGMSCTSSSF